MGVMFDSMFPKFASRSKKNKNDDVPPIVTEEELLLVNGRGINTWYVNFFGQTTEGDDVSFSYRLNITSVQFGMKAVRMYDSLLTVTYKDELYNCERDYAMIKNKQHVPLDYLSFMGNISKIEGNFGLLDLYAVMTNYEVDVAMDYPDGIVKKGFLADGKGVEEAQDMLAAGMDCQGRIRVDGADYDVTGRAWVEKRYTPVPKKSGKNMQAGSIKLWLFPDEADKVDSTDKTDKTDEGVSNESGEIRSVGDCELKADGKIPQLAVYSYYDEKANAEKVRVIAIDEEGGYECYDAESIFANSHDVWESSLTAKHYPLPMIVKVPALELEIKVVPAVYEQEMLAEDGVYSEYVGSGYYTGMCAGEPVSGACGIEMIGEFNA